MKNILWHVVKKDARRLWPWLAGWYVVLLFKAVFPAWFFSAEMKSNFNAIIFGPKAGAVLLAMDLVFLLLIVAEVSKADSPVSDGAFWRTRPISNAGMLAAKAAFFALFCLGVPGLIAGTARAAYGFNFAQGLMALGLFVLMQTAFILIAALVAVMVDRAANALLTLGLTVAVGVVLGIFFLNASNSMLSETGVRLALGVVFSAGAIGLMAIYFRHLRRWAMVWLAAGFLAALGLLVLWPATPTSDDFAGAPNLKGDAAIKLVNPHDPARDPAASSGTTRPTRPVIISETWLSGEAQWPAYATSPNSAWLPVASRSVLTYPDGTRRENNSRSLPLTGAEYAKPMNILDLLEGQGYRIWWLDDAERARQNQLYVTHVEYKLGKELEGKTFQWDGQILWQRFKMEEGLRLPVKAGSVSKRGTQVVGIMEAKFDRPYSGRFKVYLAGRISSMVAKLSDYQISRSIFLLVNDQRHEIYRAEELNLIRPDVFGVPDMMVWYQGVEFQLRNTASPDGKTPNEALTLQQAEDWLKDAHLVRFDFLPNGQFVCDFKFESFQLPGQTDK